ncbi:hypothetical protein [Aporhodopirellula aestuarii]|uniref:Uncharacterized protein n=1 Tax=Aporhodopirellula aestuarii TaxID=2950107 RepID=A0ABT0TXJ1_9BACT|nr:hypothetical protein [Aporhodopirellula aestuarii]MCM2369300.1 hypothetical protein [Aporhodopirellula aestuarii]
MRNLTIGALIIIGGTVAALPFRRAPVESGPEHNDSLLATGPSSDLAITGESITFEQLFVNPESDPGSANNHGQPNQPMTLASQAFAPNVPRGIPSDAVARPRRDLRVPLTYDDLAVPLSTPHFTDGRFDALATHQDSRAQRNAPAAYPSFDTIANRGSDPNAISRGYEAMRITAGAGPQANQRRAPWEMASDLPQSILADASERAYTGSPTSESPATVATPAPSTRPQFAPQPTSVQGRLASEARPRESQPEVTAQQSRIRHWIRQPE